MKASEFLQKIKHLQAEELLEIKGLGEVLVQNLVEFGKSDRMQSLINGFSYLESIGKGIEIDSLEGLGDFDFGALESEFGGGSEGFQTQVLIGEGGSEMASNNSTNSNSNSSTNADSDVKNPNFETGDLFGQLGFVINPVENSHTVSHQTVPNADTKPLSKTVSNFTPDPISDPISNQNSHKPTSRPVQTEIGVIIQKIYITLIELGFLGDIEGELSKKERIIEIFDGLKTYSDFALLPKLINHKNQFRDKDGGFKTSINIVITGSIEIAQKSVSREEVIKILSFLGAKIQSGVTSKTDLLLAGQKAGSKLEKATELKIPILEI